MSHIKRIRILLAEREPTTRAALRRLLEDDGMVVCAETGDADATIKTALRERPDVCLLAMPLAGDEANAIGEITAALPQTVVIVLAGAAERDRLVSAIQAGARGFLLKDMNPERLQHAISGALEGEAAIPRRLVWELLGEFRRRRGDRTVMAPSGATRLTQREWEVLELLAEGRPAAEIAKRLSLSPITVRRHISTATTKLGVSSRNEAIELVIGSS
jgi:DNA-binding NarL/FixJ family response regulator